MMRLPVQLLLLLLTSTTSAVPSPSRLFLRQDTCLPNFSVCGGGLPRNFCCPEGTKCLSLAGDTTVLCCPEGSSCEKIETVPCNLDEMDPEEFPDAPIKTTVFDVALEKCGDKCCPFGYTCNGSGQCQKDRDQSQPPKGDEEEEPVVTTTTTTTQTAEPTSEPEETETGAPEATATNDPANSGDGEEQDEDSGPNTGAIVGGVVGGCAVLLIAAVALLVVVRRRNRQKPSSPSLTEKSRNRREKTKSAGFSNIISDPISQPDQYRTDFILHPPSTGPSAERWLDRQPSNARAAPVRPPRASIPNPFNSPNPSVAGSASSRASTASFGDVRTGQVTRGARLAPIRSMKASSRHLRPSDAYGYANHNPSAESIDIFADPRAVDRPDTRQTTFTDLMDEADLSGVGRDRTFIQVPGTTPRI